MVPDESDKVERYTDGLPDNIQTSVMASKPKILQEAIELAKSLMDQKVCAYAARQADNKRRMDNNPRDNYDQQLPYKRQNMARAYTKGPSEKKEYVGTYLYATNASFTTMDRALQRHYRNECLKLKNQNCGNQTGNGEACGRVYALGGGETDQDPNNIVDDIDA
ncbi:hypothetical protein Tco_0906608 [Tanacetum coccineum]|uniref:Reverse transcriptase domain-containing protein n=1 Tax=Tanacetum coccineum TaxID=301880 RepID=A0ABQ5CHX7_9ASTR